MKTVCCLVVVVTVFLFCNSGNPVSTLPIQRSANLQLFPLAIGNLWTLSSEGNRNGGEITLNVAGDTIWHGVRYFVLHETFRDSAKPYLYFVRLDSLNRIDIVEGGVRHYILDPVIEPNQIYVNGIYNITVTQPTVVATKAGEISKCIDFYIDAPQIADEEIGFVFSPGIGIIRIYGSWGRDYRLVSNRILQ